MDAVVSCLGFVCSAHHDNGYDCSSLSQEAVRVYFGIDDWLIVVLSRFMLSYLLGWARDKG